MLKQLPALMVCLGMLLSCKADNQRKMSSKESLSDRIERLSSKHKLRTHYFDAECLYDEGDLARITQEFLSELLPEESFIVEEVSTGSNGQAVATIFHKGTEVGVIDSEGGDYLPGDFYQEIEEMPERIGNDTRIYIINPRLFGQDGCYVAGLHDNLLAAKEEGLPLVLPGENFLEEDISEFE